MSTPTRIYIVRIQEQRRLIRAATPAQARSHVARSLVSVEVASQDDIVDCMTQGIKPEKAGEEPTEQQAEQTGCQQSGTPSDLLGDPEPGPR